MTDSFARVNAPARGGWESRDPRFGFALPARPTTPISLSSRTWGRDHGRRCLACSGVRFGETRQVPYRGVAVLRCCTAVLIWIWIRGNLATALTHSKIEVRNRCDVQISPPLEVQPTSRL
jgi:hypothetical protein